MARRQAISTRPAVAAALRALHTLTAGWCQRPGFAATHELLAADGDDDIDPGRAAGQIPPPA
jgi:hypothetical protein